MRKIKSNSSLSGWRNSSLSANLVLSMLTILIVVAMTGCQNQDKKNDSSQFRYNRYAQHLTGSHYLNFIFDGYVPTTRQVSSEDFGRYEWPGSAQTQTYVSDGEQISYREYFYDDQYVSSRSEPRVRFHRRIQGYRTGQQYR